MVLYNMQSSANSLSGDSMFIVMSFIRPAWVFNALALIFNSVIDLLSTTRVEIL